LYINQTVFLALLAVTLFIIAVLIALKVYYNKNNVNDWFFSGGFTVLYKKNIEKFNESLFNNPTSEYRCTPFWAWNKKLKWEDMDEQIQVFKEMGMGGFHIHSRIGLDTPYLSDEFMDYVKRCGRKAREMNMLTWLYDEDKWPSGFGGGFVTKDHRFRSRYLLFSPYLHEDGYYERGTPQENRLGIDGTLSLIAKYEINLKNGYLNSYRRLDNDETGENIWYAYRVVSKDLPLTF
jgi:hypothetical protein